MNFCIFFGAYSQYRCYNSNESIPLEEDMKIGAIIAEYNPFHNGHKYQIGTFREKQSLDYVIVIMSGDFTQRGEPAWMPKHLRAKAALMGGADLILELPVYYATGSAQIFAEGAVAHLNALNSVDALCFGCETMESETRHLKWLETAAAVLLEEPESFRENLSKALKSGLSYAAARAKALESFIETPELLAMPNNILALEYITALRKTGSSICPVPVRRKGEGYHSQKADRTFASASAIRKAFPDINPSAPWFSLPDGTQELIKTHFNKDFPLTPEDFSPMFASAFLRSAPDLHQYADVTEEISNRMMHCFKKYRTLDDFLLETKNKSCTYSRLCRCAAHILLELRKDTLIQAKTDGFAYYARILGFREKASPLFGYLKKNTSIPLITKMASYPKHLSDNGRHLMEADIRAADYYRTALQIKFGQTLKNEFNQKIIIL